MAKKKKSVRVRGGSDVALIGQRLTGISQEIAQIAEMAQSGAMTPRAAAVRLHKLQRSVRTLPEQARGLVADQVRQAQMRVLPQGPAPRAIVPVQAGESPVQQAIRLGMRKAQGAERLATIKEQARGRLGGIRIPGIIGETTAAAHPEMQPVMAALEKAASPRAVRA